MRALDRAFLGLPISTRGAGCSLVGGATTLAFLSLLLAVLP